MAGLNVWAVIASDQVILLGLRKGAQRRIEETGSMQFLGWAKTPYNLRRNTSCTLALFTAFCTLTACHAVTHGHSHGAQVNDWSAHHEWHEIGDGHGEIAVSQSGDIVVSVIDVEGGVHIYTPDGALKRKLTQVPDDIHGFQIHVNDAGEEHIYATQLSGGDILQKYDMAGNLLLSVPKTAIPQDLWVEIEGEKEIRATSVAVSRDGQVFVSTGYGRDLIHVFDLEGNYLKSWGGREAPYSFINAHKIYVDPRYEAPRLMVTDRWNGRLMHLTMDGEIIGEFAATPTLPGAVAFYKDYAAVGELDGRITVYDKTGDVVRYIGTNDVKEEIRTNQTPPDKWREGVLTAPHSLAFDPDGNLYVTEWNIWGRILVFAGVETE